MRIELMESLETAKTKRVTQKGDRAIVSPLINEVRKIVSVKDQPNSAFHVLK